MPPSRQRQGGRQRHPHGALGLAGSLAIGAMAFGGMVQISPAGEPCEIEGNISLEGGERIYHVPGQDHHEETTIRTDYGERWFCTEAEARAAGWRRVRR